MRISILLLALLCASALLAAPAGADTTVTVAGSDVAVTAAAGEPNAVTITAGTAPGTVRIADASDALADATAACAAVDATTLDCPVSGRVTLALGDGDDPLAPRAAPVPVPVDAGEGDDTLALANGRVDDVTCGTGRDDASHADAGDTLPFDCEVVGPETTFDTHPVADTNRTSADFTFSAPEAGTYECSLDGDLFAACDATASFAGLDDGPHTFSVRATNRFGRTEASPAVFAWTVDTDAPTVRVSASPQARTNQTRADIGFTAADAVTAECRLDTGAWL